MKPIICLRKLAALGLVAALCLEAPGLQAYAAMGEISNPSGEPLLMKVDAPLGSPISMGEGSDHLNEPSLQMPGIPLSSADQLKEINQEIPTLIQPQTVGIKKENLAEKKLVTPPTSETQMPANQKISKTPSSFSIRKLATILKNTFSFSSINKDAGIEANPSQKTLSRFFDGSLSAQMSSKNVNRDISRLSPNSSLKRFNASGNSKIPPSSQNDFPNVPPGPWGSSSPRVGLSYTGMKYLAMRTFSAFFDQVNRYKPWYALPRTIAAFNLAAIEMRMRLINIFNTDAYASRTPLIGQATSDQIRAQNPAGLGHDTAAPQMGAANARFNRASKPELHGGTVPSTIADTLVRASNELEKREHFIPARILNVHAAAWIQFMVHDWMNHVRAPIADNPHKIALPAGHPLNEKEMTLDRTAANGSRPENDPGAPTYQNTETHWWDLSMIYGSSPEILKGLRSFEGGKMIIGDDGRLPADPMKEGVDKTGFNSNYWTGLSILHTLFVKEHNSIAEALAAEHPQWTDQQLFEKARLINVALAATLHTVEWTRALLPNSTMQVSMWADWYGVIGKKTKLWLMTHIYPRYPRLAKWLTVRRESDYLSGVPGTRYYHFPAFKITQAF